jgi:hypothetical protein
LRWLTVSLGLIICLGGGVLAQARPAIYVPPACQTLTFQSEPTLNPQRVCMNVGLATHRVARDTYLFITQDAAGAGIFSPSGTLVWWQRPAPGKHEHDARVVRLWGQPYLAVWSGGASTSSGSSGAVELYNQHYVRVGTITAGAPYRADGLDLHEFRLTADGDVLVGVDVPQPMTLDGHSVTVVQYVVQKLSLVRDATGIHTGRVLFQWNSLSHVPISQSHQAVPSSGPYDYFHGNSISQDSDGNLVVSARNTWGIYKISERTGQVLWEVGAKGDHALKQPWCYQHDITALGDHRYSLFDDGGDGSGCSFGSTGHAARGIIFRVVGGTQRPQVRLIHAYTHTPAIYSDWMGSIQQLANGNALVDWGTTPEVTEFDSSGRRMALDLSLSQASYRAFSFRWRGSPTTPPSVAGRHIAGGTEVWASWNGSTRVAAWRVRGGSSPSSLSAVSGPVHTQGFETVTQVSHLYRYIQVVALSQTGQALGRSKVIAPTGG